MQLRLARATVGSRRARFDSAGGPSPGPKLGMLKTATPCNGRRSWHLPTSVRPGSTPGERVRTETKSRWRRTADTTLMATKNPMSADNAENTDEYTLPDLTGFQRDLLRMVSHLESPKGLAIKSELEAGAYGEIHHGRLYPNLDELVEKGLIEKGERDRRTNFYEMTSRGRRELESYAGWVNSSLQGDDN